MLSLVLMIVMLLLLEEWMSTLSTSLVLAAFAIYDQVHKERIQTCVDIVKCKRSCVEPRGAAWNREELRGTAKNCVEPLGAVRKCLGR